MVHADVDILEYKFTHDAENVYAYFKATGVIGNTQVETYDGDGAVVDRAGRYYVIVTIDVDNDDATGYPLHEGGYYPTTPGYDMNFEVEYYNGEYNTGHYLQHGCLNLVEKEQAFIDQSFGLVDVRAGTYAYYTQWVWWDNPLTGDILINEDYSDGSHTDASITWVWDKEGIYNGVIIEVNLSADGTEIEVKAPFRGFMKYLTGHNEEAIMKLGRTIDASFSLEASGELAVVQEWASDTGQPIVGYFLSVLTYAEDLDQDDMPDAWESLYGVTDPAGDLDGDGVTNLDEYLQGLNPNDNEVWVNFSGASGGNGTEALPYRTLADGVAAVLTAGTVHVLAGTSAETSLMNSALRLEAEGGTVRLGE